MKRLPNLLVIAWSILIGGSLLLSYATSGSDPAARAWDRIETFLGWQGAALVVALIAAGAAWRRKEPRGTQGWWMGWGPLLGQAVIAVVVGLAVITSKLI